MAGFYHKTCHTQAPLQELEVGFEPRYWQPSMLDELAQDETTVQHRPYCIPAGIRGEANSKEHEKFSSEKIFQTHCLIIHERASYNSAG